MKVKIKDIENKDTESFNLVFDWLGRERRALYDTKIKQGLKVDKSLGIGDYIEVLRNIIPSRKDPSKYIEVYKIVKVYN